MVHSNGDVGARSIEAEWRRAQLVDVIRTLSIKARAMVERYPNTYRTKFIPEIKDIVASNLANQGIRPEQIAHALQLWEAGKPPETPTDWGCFEVFDTLQKQIDQGAR